MLSGLRQFNNFCFRLDHASKETTVVHQIFGGTLRSQGNLCLLLNVPSWKMYLFTVFGNLY